ncbi:transcription antitermination factor NusB [Inconstantimicrobium mannanitabidum]|uniref:N utilization substance protein B n=1 Tax=Inconstantimicrobium mannanitabidum TaxID=1604901 RepID=A0ACB5RAU9_9CLOT|nr:transcription antitermination factor NusB [Clostridium sp. TW13]GKX66154.1 N utilization substance protein B [Clostridium sp. TW13]
MNRVKSREIAVQLTYQRMINKESVEEIIENFKENFDDNMNEGDFKYIREILEGIDNTTEELDKIIKESLVNWKIERISKINLAILRVATYEIIYVEDIPDKVSINEAIEITKKYSEEKSVSFINAVLDKVLKRK